MEATVVLLWQRWCKLCLHEYSSLDPRPSNFAIGQDTHEDTSTIGYKRHLCRGQIASILIFTEQINTENYWESDNLKILQRPILAIPGT